MSREYQHIKMLMRAGITPTRQGKIHVEEGQLGIDCPACPHALINLPRNWENSKNALVILV